MIPGLSPPGWSAFDPERVDELRLSAKSPDAPCPFKGHHDHRLPWRSGDYRQGTDFHGDPPVSFRVSPTYILENRRDNFILDQYLIEQLEGKAETWRLGNENSEDALSFNVLRSLQEAGALAESVRLLVGVDVTDEPDLAVWGRWLGRASTRPVPELHAALTELERWPGQKTEPESSCGPRDGAGSSSRRSSRAQRGCPRTQKPSRNGRRPTVPPERSTSPQSKPPTPRPSRSSFATTAVVVTPAGMLVGSGVPLPAWWRIPVGVLRSVRGSRAYALRLRPVGTARLQHAARNRYSACDASRKAAAGRRLISARRS